MNWDLLHEEIKNRDVYIWGYDIKGHKFFDICEKNGVKVKGFIDTYAQSKEIMAPDKIIVKGASKNIYIIVSMLLRNRKDILKQLEENGFEEHDFFYPCNEWSYLGFEWRYTSISSYQEQKNLGRNIAEALENKKFYFLLTGGHIGDEILALSYLYAVKEKMRLREITVITTKNYLGLVRLYEEDIDEVVVMLENEIEALRIYANSNQKEHYNIIGADWRFIGKEYKVPFPLAQILFKTKHLGLKYDVKSKYIKGVGVEDEGFKNFINKTGLKREKSIILIPYAQSAGMLPIIFWEMLAKALSNKYEVYTNIGPKELEIKGTSPLYIPFEYVIDTINYAGKAISIRCGLTDIVALGKCNCQVLYAIDKPTDIHYLNATSLYINGKESILYKNAIYLNIRDEINDLVNCVLKRIEQNDEDERRGAC